MLARGCARRRKGREIKERVSSRSREVLDERPTTCATAARPSSARRSAWPRGRAGGRSTARRRQDLGTAEPGGRR